MDKIPFVDGTKTQEAYVTINEQNYPVTPAVWTGTTPVSAFLLNKLQDNVENAININRAKLILQNTISANTNYTIPVPYQVGNDSLEIYYCGFKLQKGDDYTEIGTEGEESTTIQFLTTIGDLDMSNIIEDFEETLEFIVRGDYNVE